MASFIDGDGECTRAQVQESSMAEGKTRSSQTAEKMICSNKKAYTGAFFLKQARKVDSRFTPAEPCPILHVDAFTV